MQLSPLIAKMCAVAGKYNREKVAYTPSSGQGAYAVKCMEKIAEELNSSLHLSSFGKLSTFVSKGQGKVPKVLWIAILPNGRTVGNSASVTICFGRQGEGIVAGLMVSKGGGHLHLRATQRQPQDIKINVDGDKPGTKFGNSFVNPKEWLVEDLNDEQILEHLLVSLKLLLTIERV